VREIYLDDAVGEFSDLDEEEHAHELSLHDGVRRGSSEESLLLDNGEFAFDDQYYEMTSDLY